MLKFILFCLLLCASYAASMQDEGTLKYDPKAEKIFKTFVGYQLTTEAGQPLEKGYFLNLSESICNQTYLPEEEEEEVKIAQQEMDAFYKIFDKDAPIYEALISAFLQAKKKDRREAMIKLVDGMLQSVKEQLKGIYSIEDRLKVLQKYHPVNQLVFYLAVTGAILLALGLLAWVWLDQNPQINKL